jgi:glycosyltransferase involved in cell wall biosynthesis
LADAISHLLAQEAIRLAFGRAGRKRAEDFFSLAATVAQHEQVFLRLINGEGRP